MEFKALLNFTVSGIIYNKDIIYRANLGQAKLIRELPKLAFG